MAANGKTKDTETLGKVKVSVRDNEIVLSDFHEDDPVVVGVAREAEDPEEAIHIALQAGARSVRVAGTALDTHAVEQAFDGMTDRFGRAVEDASKQISEKADELLDEDDGALPGMLEQFRDGLDGVLGDAFDEDSKTSIIGKFDSLVRDLRKQEREAIGALLDTGSDKSPLRRVQRDLTESFRKESEAVRVMVGELSEKVAASAAAAEVYEKTAIKGSSFEEVLHQVVSELVTPLGDMASATGTETGCAGSKKGDEVVLINPEDTRGVETTYVFEAKDRKRSLDAILTELDEARENRNSEAAIAVFSREEHAPIGVAFAYYGDRAIVVLDKDELDTTALRLATMWARWVARRKLVDEREEVDVEAIERLIEEAVRVLNSHTTIKRHHTTAKNGIDGAAKHVADLVREIEDILGRLKEELR